MNVSLAVKFFYGRDLFLQKFCCSIFCPEFNRSKGSSYLSFKLIMTLCWFVTWPLDFVKHFVVRFLRLENQILKSLILLKIFFFLQIHKSSTSYWQIEYGIRNVSRNLDSDIQIKMSNRLFLGTDMILPSTLYSSIGEQLVFFNFGYDD